MRLDKWLKVTGLIKRRAIAKEMCESGFVLVNGRIGKPDYSVRVGDKIEIVSPKLVTVIVEDELPKRGFGYKIST
ncbi:RNA-binding S4 domain protein [Thermodesulfobium narugense DSM 14796]|uniref:RNA-binding S4 domain protein n=1 Tax=Thermodesulfobium narugense DSM 14796 TaxID=747365 RepID=M1E4G1_9BACT|nr:S4 domain-containing protein [Thermodesulfobium narugense]AEE14122.1 RNA-binding S4 domain protein [Thermodesulfobium narugense DSM 14796]